MKFIFAFYTFLGGYLENANNAKICTAQKRLHSQYIWLSVFSLTKTIMPIS